MKQRMIFSLALALALGLAACGGSGGTVGQQGGSPKAPVNMFVWGPEEPIYQIGLAYAQAHPEDTGIKSIESLNAARGYARILVR